MFDTAIQFLNELDELGYESYIIGGYVRDKMLGIKSNDIDITTNATPSIIKKNFTVIEDNSKYGSLTIDYKGKLIEVTTFRIEIDYNGRYPIIEYVETLKEDLIRRDFTINTICINKNKEVIDLMNGINDLNKKLIRCIGNPSDRIKEDPIRILRALRLATNLNFELDDELKKSILNNGKLLNKLTISQTKRELDKMNNMSLIHELKLDKYLRS